MNEKDFLSGRQFYNKNYPIPDDYRYKMKYDEFGRKIIVRTDEQMHSGIYVDSITDDGQIVLCSYWHKVAKQQQPVISLSDLILNDLPKE